MLLNQGPLLGEGSIDLVATVTAALLASFHCAGMCGGFSMAASAGRGLIGSQSLYHAGKTLAYLVIGLTLTRASRGLGDQLASGSLFKGLSLVAGLLLVGAGVHALRRRAHSPLVRPENLERRSLTGEWKRFLARVHAHTGRSRPLLLGMLSGFLPCPLVYAFAFKAASSGSEPAALATMLALAVGTAPILLGMASGGRWLGPRLRLGLSRISGLFLILLGVFTWLRGWNGLPPCH